MADISKIKIGNTTYDIKDVVARNGNPFLVTVSGTSTYTADKTFAQILEAYQGDRVVVVFDASNNVYYCTSCSNSLAVFVSKPTADTNLISLYKVTSSNAWSHSDIQFTVPSDLSDKYEKPSTGIPYSDLASGVLTSLDKADTALLAHLSLAAVFGKVSYNSTAKKIYFYDKDANISTATPIGEVDATDFIKDGMVDNVEIKDVTLDGQSVRCLVVSFNTVSGKEDINIPLTDIFNPSNYYTKSEIDNAGYLTTYTAPGTLNTNNSSAQTVNASEALSGTVKLHKIAKTGTYSDLIGTPTIPPAPGTLDTNNSSAQTVPSTVEELSGKISLHKIAKTGTYSDLIGTPTNVSSFTNDAGYTTNVGTITGITMNGASKGTSGVVNLGNVLTSVSVASETLTIT